MPSPKKKLPTGPIRIEPLAAKQSDVLSKGPERPTLDSAGEAGDKIPEEQKQDSGMPESSKLESSRPESSSVDSTKPESTILESSSVDSTKPESGRPDSTNPESSNPESSKLESGKLESGKLESTKLDSTKLDSTKLDSSIADSTKLDSSIADSSRRESTKLDSTRLESSIESTRLLDLLVEESNKEESANRKPDTPGEPLKSGELSFSYPAFGLQETEYKKVAMRLTAEAVDILRQLRATTGVPYEILVDVMIRNWDNLPARTRNAYLQQAKEARVGRLIAGQEKTLKTMQQKYLS